MVVANHLPKGFNTAWLLRGALRVALVVVFGTVVILSSGSLAAGGAVGPATTPGTPEPATLALGCLGLLGLARIGNPRPPSAA